MDKFFRGIIGILSFLLVVGFCLSDNIKKNNKQQKFVAGPLFDSVEFRQVPAVIELGEKNENKFNWKTPKRHR